MSSMVRVIAVVFCLATFGVDASHHRLSVSLELPRFSGPTEPPYLAFWYRQGERYQPLLVQRDKVKWLRDLKVFWREFARYNRQQVDAVTSATRRVRGGQRFEFQLPASDMPLQLWVEVVRENGERELLATELVVGEESLCILGQVEIAKLCAQLRPE